MSIPYALAVYFMMWWIVLFAILPFGVRTQEEEGQVVPGTVESAPARFRMLRTVGWTTAVTTLLFLGFLWLRQSGITLDDIPLPGPR
ncbi:DUF1467 family protein [Microvirga tunisiensis]|uniref:DUF1467 family protein n=1 Tax=Pannonibacter tanglangensis TaxID=2750084 RepID=A0A7X5J8Z1_9HYPH|nr:DUF1467 family protein [Pannonibacter sp. XCT-53]NBN77986.1 DUF1467 family protein [Pannonibacter sp. XCT-53]